MLSLKGCQNVFDKIVRLFYVKTQPFALQSGKAGRLLGKASEYSVLAEILIYDL